MYVLMQGLRFNKLMLKGVNEFTISRVHAKTTKQIRTSSDINQMKQFQISPFVLVAIEAPLFTANYLTLPGIVDVRFNCRHTDVKVWPCWRHDVETLSTLLLQQRKHQSIALLSVCEGIIQSPVDSPHIGLVMRSFDVFLLFQHAIELTGEIPVIWDAIRLMWCHCNYKKNVSPFVEMR